MNAPVVPRTSLLPAHLGQVDEVNQRLDRMLARHVPISPPPDDLTQAWLDIALPGGSGPGRAPPGGRTAAAAVRRQHSVHTGVTGLTCIARHLGGAAALLGRYDEARQHYQEAIRVCTEMRFRPELALTRLQLAELLLEHYPAEKKDALEHLDFAIKEFREMKMRPSLERALRHKEILKA